jgi:hypothetical protein
VKEDAFDEFASVVFGIEKGHWGGGWDGKTENHGSIWIRTNHTAREVGHVEARKEECGRDANGADIGFYFGFRVEMVSTAKSASRFFFDIDQRAPDEMFNAVFLSCVGDVFALSNFGFF